MKAFFRASLIPEGFAVEGVDTRGAAMVIAIRATGTASLCPVCASPSLRIHSRYRRRALNYPSTKPAAAHPCSCELREDNDVIDIQAIRNAVVARWSNGQTEGQINRLKNREACNVRQGQGRPAQGQVVAY